MPPRLGAHMSIAGGIHRAVDRARLVQGEALQLFTRPANQWAARPLDEEDCRKFQVKVEQAGLQPVLAHDSYLINIASPDPELWAKSVGALAVELERCAALAIPFLVMHPGAHVGAGEQVGISNIVRALDEILNLQVGRGVTVLLENTAGQGTVLGHRFDQLALIIEQAQKPERLGVCLDTAHAFAAGYDLSSAAGWDAALREIDDRLGWKRVRALHVNDSKKGCGSRVDRHEQIGLGLIGIEPFWRLMNDPRFHGLPGALETEKGEEGLEDEQNLGLLRRLIGLSAPPRRRQVMAWREAALVAARARRAGAPARPVE